MSTPALPFIGIRCPTAACGQHVPPHADEAADFLFLAQSRCTNFSQAINPIS